MRKILVLVVLALSACQSEPAAPPPAPAPAAQPVIAAAPKLPSAPPAPVAAPAAAPAVPSGPNPIVVMKTSMGDIKLELFADKSPISVGNFMGYVASKQYEGTIFHRVIKGFMIQGGGFTKDMVEKPTGPMIKNESQNGLKNDRGTIAMARRPDPNSATAQFYINVVDNNMLNYPAGGGYAVFGKVVDGMDVVDKIREVPTGVQHGMGDVPTTQVTILSVSRG